MNLKMKIVLAFFMLAIIVAFDFIVLINSAKATNISQISNVNLHYGGTCEQLLKYKGVIIKTNYVEYYGDDGKSYPAYCLDKLLIGVNDEFEYTVATSARVQDVGLWRTIINGYPYKSIEELGVANEREAFTATKQAVYCYLFENTPDDYEAIGEAGDRTLNALRQIVANAQSSTENINDNTITITEENEEWTEDEIDSNFISKIYSINSQAYHIDYEVLVKSELPKKSIIAKIDGTECSKFTGEEKFKIMLPKEELDSEGSFELEIKTEVKTKPILYGDSPDASLQNYALTAYMYEDAVAQYKGTYPKIEKPKEPEVPKEPEKPKVVEKTIVEEKIKILPETGM